MKTFDQTHYQEPEAFPSLSEEPLVIHRHKNSKHKKDAPLIVMVHGLGGSRYGEKSTWGSIPAFLFEDVPHADIGMYEYRTLLGRVAFRHSVDLETEARVLAEVLRDATGHSRIFLVGHSMGGLPCMAALSHLYASNQTVHLSRMAGLLLMAVPQTGSQRVPGWLAWFSKDFQALKPHGAIVTRIQRTVTDAFSLDETAATPKRFTIPTWAVLAGADVWVDRLSAAVHLPAERCKTVRGSHTSIVKPSSKDADAYQFIRQCIETALVSKQTQTASPQGSGVSTVPKKKQAKDSKETGHSGTRFSINADKIDSVTQAEHIDRLTQKFGDIYNATVEGSGAVAQGPGSTAAGKGGVTIGGNISGSTIITGNRSTMTTAPQQGGIRAGVIHAKNVVDGLQAKGADPRQLVQLVRDIRTGGISADRIQAENVVSGLQIIDDPSHATVDDLRREFDAFFQNVHQVLIDGRISNPDDAMDVKSDMADLKSEFAKSNPSEGRIIRKLGALSEILAGAVAAASVQDAQMISITRQAAGLWLTARNHWEK